MGINKRKSVKTERIILRIEPELEDAIKQLAETSNNSLSSIITKLINIGIVHYYIDSLDKSPSDSSCNRLTYPTTDG